MNIISATWLRLLVLVGLLGAAGQAAGQAPGWTWAKSPGAGYTSNTVTDSLGNVYITGSFAGTAVFGSTTLSSVAGTNDIFVAKLTPSGTYAWAVRAGDRGDDICLGLAVDDGGNVLISGYFTSGSISFGNTRLTSIAGFNPYVAKLTTDGTWQWAVSADGNGVNVVEAVAADNLGNVFVTGRFSSATIRFGSTTLINPGSSDREIFVAKLSPTGTWLWATSAGGIDNDYVTGIKTDQSGNAYITGDFSSPTISFGPITLINSGAGDVFVAKISSSGVYQWAAHAGGSINDLSGDIAIDDAGSVVITGSFGGTTTFGSTTLTSAGSFDLFVAKLSPAGNWQWATKAGGGDTEIGRGVTIDRSGNVYVTGRFNGSAAGFGATSLASVGDYDVFVAKLSAVGAWQWATRAGGNATEVGEKVAVDGNGNGYIAGMFTSRASTFGPTTLASSSAGNSSVFLARLSTVTGLLNESPEATFTLAPNPAQTTVNLSGVPESIVTLLDGLGRLIRTAPVTGGAATLDVRGLSPGLYVVRAGQAARRLMVE